MGEECGGLEGVGWGGVGGLQKTVQRGEKRRREENERRRRGEGMKERGELEGAKLREKR